MLELDQKCGLGTVHKDGGGVFPHRRWGRPPRTGLPKTMAAIVEAGKDPLILDAS